MVNVARLEEALRRCVWKQGGVYRASIAHDREPNGDHRFTVVVPQELCEPEPLPPAASGSPLAHSSGVAGDRKPRL
jgi:hypothetical protein